MTKPYKYRGYWLWKYDGYYDVHERTEEPCSSSVIAEGMSLNEAKQFVRETRAIESLTACAQIGIVKVKQ